MSPTPYHSILIFGPPGSGKGTQSKVLQSLFLGELYHLSSGDLFRELKEGSPESKLFHQYADKGCLVPDKDTITIWHNYVQGLVAEKRYNPQNQKLLLDGIPRTLKQAEFIEPYIQVEKIIILDIEDLEALCSRLLKRAQVDNRKDDVNIDIIHNRMKIYKEETLKVLQHYPDEKKISVNANQAPKDVLKDILNKW